MFGGIYQAAATLGMILMFYIGDVWLMRRFDPSRAEGSGRSWSWTLFSVSMAAIVVLQPVVLPWLGLYTEAMWGLWVQALGLVLMAGGLALHWWARWHLGQFYGERVELQPGQYVVEGGPYAYVRHPIYTSFFLCIVGLLLVNPSLTTLAVTVYFFWDFPRAARKEEVLLSVNLPGYREYMARTTRYLPSLRHLLEAKR
jgi:protein-S-isoprenylcysteine O-methyltransferase Ste14